MDKLLSKIKSGVETYQKTFPKNYKFILSLIRPIVAEMERMSYNIELVCEVLKWLN